MAGVGFARNEIDVLARAMNFEIEVEVPGWTDPVAVPTPAVPGAVRGAVEKVLREVGLTTVPRPTRSVFP